MIQPKTLPTHVIRDICAKADACDPTVRKILRGEPTRGSVGDRVKAELANRGYDVPQMRTRTPKPEL